MIVIIILFVWKVFAISMKDNVRSYIFTVIYIHMFRRK